MKLSILAQGEILLAFKAGFKSCAFSLRLPGGGRFSARHGVPHAPRGAGKAEGDKSAKHRKKRVVTRTTLYFAVRARFELAEPKTGSAV